MKVEWRLLGGLGVFLFPITALYWFTSYEQAGSVLLLFFALALLFMGAYLLSKSRGLPPRPEDRTDATPDEGSQDLGYFPTGSIWPLVIGGGATLIAYGLAFTVWLAMPGIMLLVVAAAGYARDAQRATHHD